VTVPQITEAIAHTMLRHAGCAQPPASLSELGLGVSLKPPSAGPSGPAVFPVAGRDYSVGDKIWHVAWVGLNFATVITSRARHYVPLRDWPCCAHDCS
jgi:hypothetical protein